MYEYVQHYSTDDIMLRRPFMTMGSPLVTLHGREQS